MSVHVPAGEVKEIAQLEPSYRLRITGAPLYLSHSRSEARNKNAVRYPEGTSGTLADLGIVSIDSVFAYNDSTASATIEIDKFGFSLRDTFLEFIGVENKPGTDLGVTFEGNNIGTIPFELAAATIDLGVTFEGNNIGNIPIELAAAVATIDAKITGSDINIPIELGSGVTSLDQNITGQDVDVDTIVTKQGFLGRTEVNADQTATVTAGSTQTTTITADAGEVWELQKIRLFAPSISDNEASDGQNFTVQTESAGIIIGEGRSHGGGSSSQFNNAVEYTSGEWLVAGDGSHARDDMVGVRIDDTDGLQVIYENEFDTEDQTGNRDIRLAFEKVAT